MNNIAVFGDSIARWAWDRELWWRVNRLRLFIDREYADVFSLVYNCAVDWDTSERMLKRFEVECASRTTTLVIFAVWINDAAWLIDKQEHQVPLDQYKNNMIQLISLAKQQPTVQDVVCLGLTSVDESKTVPLLRDSNIECRNAYIKQYDDILKSVCEEQSVWYIDIFNDVDNSDLDDGEHPTIWWHQKIFERVRDYAVESDLIRNSE